MKFVNKQSKPILNLMVQQIVKHFNPRILVARVRAGQRTVEMRQRVESSERLQQRQIAHMAIMTRKLRQAALTDVLTNLPNRRYGMNRLQEEWETAQRNGTSLSVAMMDIDFFKKVNDKYGHDAGDVPCVTVHLVWL